MKIFYRSICLFCIALAVSCECVPTVDTPKDISPKTYANTALIHNIEGVASLKVENQKLNLIQDWKYQATPVSYSKILSGLSSIKLKLQSSGLTIFNILTDFAKSKYYTACFYGQAERIKYYVCSDDIAWFEDSKSLVRIINLTEHSDLNIELIKQKDTSRFVLNYERHKSQMIETTQTYTINVYDDSTSALLIHRKDQVFAGKVMHNLILSSTKSNTITLKNIQVTIPEN